MPEKELVDGEEAEPGRAARLSEDEGRGQLLYPWWWVTGHAGQQFPGRSGRQRQMGGSELVVRKSVGGENTRELQGGTEGRRVVWKGGARHVGVGEVGQRMRVAVRNWGGISGHRREPPIRARLRAMLYPSLPFYCSPRSWEEGIITSLLMRRRSERRIMGWGARWLVRGAQALGAPRDSEMCTCLVFNSGYHTAYLNKPWLLLSIHLSNIRSASIKPPSGPSTGA